MNTINKRQWDAGKICKYLLLAVGCEGREGRDGGRKTGGRSLGVGIGASVQKGARICFGINKRALNLLKDLIKFGWLIILFNNC